MTEPSRLDILKNLRVSNLDAAFITVFGTLVGGAFMVGFIRMVVGDEHSAMWIGVMSFVGAVGGITMLPGSVFGRSKASYKPFTRTPALWWRFCYIPLALFPFLPFLGVSRLYVVAILAAVGSLFVNYVSPIYNEWLAEMVPVNSRGFFFSRRNAIVSVVGAIAGVLGGLALDGFKGRGLDAIGFGVLFSVALVCAFVSQYWFDRMSDLPRKEVIPVDWATTWTEFKRPLADKRFSVVLAFSFVWLAGHTFAGNLFAAYALESLNLSFTAISVFGLLFAGGVLALSGFWGFLTDRYGVRPILALGALGITFSIVPWLLTVPGKDAVLHNLILLGVSHFFMGAIWAGAAPGGFNLLVATSPPAQRATYLATGQSVSIIACGVAPLLGAAMLAALRTHMDVAMAYKAVFVTNICIRVVAFFMLLLVKEEGAQGIVKAVHDISKVTPKGFRAMRRLTTADTEQTRGEAIRELASTRYLLASEQIVDALHDPSPQVRREAATALSRMGHASGADALIHQLEEHPDLVEEETVDALGRIGDSRSTPHLAKFLQSPRSQVRRAAARALGRIADPRSVPVLMEAARTDDIELRRSAMHALRRIGAQEASEVIVEAIRDAHPSVRIAAAEAAIEMQVHDVAPIIRESLPAYDEASCELAYALGCLGDRSDLQLILRCAENSRSVITRRRCLLGAARLLDIEAPVYRFMLMDDMARDTAVMEAMSHLAKRNSKVKAALEHYATGDDARALAALSAAHPYSALDALKQHPCAEAFLVGACYFADRAKTNKGDD